MGSSMRSEWQLLLSDIIYWPRGRRCDLRYCCLIFLKKPAQCCLPTPSRRNQERDIVAGLLRLRSWAEREPQQPALVDT
jgi:hypothetical protein